MAVANVTELWQLAATMMGETGTHVVTDATTPVLPLELTFNALYAQVRTESLKQVSPQFAQESADLRAAPTKRFDGSDSFWIARTRWNYAYTDPLTSIKFLGFENDNPDLGLVTNFRRIPMPIDFVSVTTTGSLGAEFYLPLFGGYLFQGYMWAEVEDESYVTHSITDLSYPDDTTYPNTFRFVDENGTLIQPALEYGDYNDSATTTIYIAVSDWDWGTAAYPSSIVVNAAIEPATRANWSELIFTNHYNARGVYLVDVTDPALWTDEFVMLVAATMARRAAVVHSKSEKLISGLNQEYALALSTAIADEASDDDSLAGMEMSSTEKARL